MLRNLLIARLGRVGWPVWGVACVLMCSIFLEATDSEKTQYPCTIQVMLVAIGLDKATGHGPDAGRGKE